MKRMQGAALLLVLWVIALLTTLIGAFALTARMEYLQGRVSRGQSVAQQIAQAGTEYALVRLADERPESRWLPDGRRYAWSFAQATVSVRVVDETGKVDLNQADVGLLVQLMQALEVEPAQAGQLAAAILDWRDVDDLSQPQGGAEDPDYASAGLDYGAKDAPFDSLDELQQVLGMTAEIHQRLLPYLSLYSGRSMPDVNFAAAPVLTAMGLDATAVLAQRELAAQSPTTQLVGAGSGTYSIDSRAVLADGRQAVLTTVLRVGGGPLPGSAYTVLRWEEGVASP